MLKEYVCLSSHLVYTIFDLTMEKQNYEGNNTMYKSILQTAMEGFCLSVKEK